MVLRQNKANVCIQTSVTLYIIKRGRCGDLIEDGDHIKSEEAVLFSSFGLEEFT